jgi:AraC-like DNA-binding protein
VPSPHKRLRDVRFANERLDAVGVEVLTLSQLRGRVSARWLADPERVEFFMVLIVNGGRGEHVVDFERVPMSRGCVVFVRPGQVQQWRAGPGCEAEMLLIEPAVLQPTGAAHQQPAMAVLRLEEWPNRFVLDHGELSLCRSLVKMLRRELDVREMDALSVATARQLLSCLMLGMSRSATRHAADLSTPALLARRFQRELEGLVSTRPSVALLARRLRVSTSTLTRTCRDKLGRSAKELVDRRVALEAQRLLVHSPATSVAIGEQLGFSEPTNFVKFFRRLVGTTPEAFRKAHRLP